MQYMVVETYLRGAAPVYMRVAECGRMLPPGLQYIASWVDGQSFNRCFQLMETDDEQLLVDWMAAWSDLIAFEPVPVISSAEAAAHVPPAVSEQTQVTEEKPA